MGTRIGPDAYFRSGSEAVRGHRRDEGGQGRPRGSVDQALG